MGSGSGKAKGAQFERDTCVQLSLWVSGGKHQDLFWRSAMSGGRATQGRKSGVMLRRQAGDVTATSAEGCNLTDTFLVECKHYRSLDLMGFLLKEKGNLAAFWKVLMVEALNYNKVPLLIAKQNFYPTIVVSTIGSLPCPASATFRNEGELALFQTLLDTNYTLRCAP